MKGPMKWVVLILGPNHQLKDVRSLIQSQESIPENKHYHSSDHKRFNVPKGSKSKLEKSLDENR